MKITIYTLTTCDDGQMDTSFFDTEEDRDAEIRGLLQEHLGDDWAAVRTNTGDDVEALYSLAQNEHAYEIDLHWTEHEIDLPTEPVNVGLLAAAKMWASRLEGFDDMQIARRADPWTIDAHKRTLAAIAAAELANKGESLANIMQSAIDKSIIRDLLDVAREVQLAFGRLAAEKGMSGEPFHALLKQVNRAIEQAEQPRLTWAGVDLAESPAPMQNTAKTRVFVRVYGGSVQSIASDMPSAIEAFILDEDNDSPNWGRINIDTERQSIADKIVFAAGKV